jgi:hypothetical protein
MLQLAIRSRAREPLSLVREPELELNDVRLGAEPP